jgi:hypothetical protein
MTMHTEVPDNVRRSLCFLQHLQIQNPKRGSLRFWATFVFLCVPKWAATCTMLTPGNLPILPTQIDET